MRGGVAEKVPIEQFYRQTVDMARLLICTFPFESNLLQHI
jgi:hypothetical protein